MKYLANLPEETVGNVYYKFLLKNVRELEILQIIIILDYRFHLQ